MISFNKWNPDEITSAKTTWFVSPFSAYFYSLKLIQLQTKRSCISWNESMHLSKVTMGPEN